MGTRKTRLASPLFSLSGAATILHCKALVLPALIGLTLGCSGGDPGGSSDAELAEQCVRLTSCLQTEEEPLLTVPGGLACNMAKLIALGNLDADRSTDRKTDIRFNQALIACAESSNSCEEMRACLEDDPTGYLRKATSEELQLCADRGSREVCSGTRLVDCHSDPAETVLTYDCAEAGLICGQDDHGATCGEKTCESEATVCAGDLIVYCNHGVERWSDCAWDGETCEDSSCVGTGDACDEGSFDERCEGSVAVSCASGKIAQMDCGRLSGMTCKVIGGDAECDFEGGCYGVGLAGETCNGSSVEFCFAGEYVEVDCEDLGYADCEQVTDYAWTTAYCVN